MSRLRRSRLVLGAAVVVCGAGLAACSSATSTPNTPTTTAASADDATSAPDGLVAYVDDHGVEVADPHTGASRLVVPIDSLETGTAANRRFLIDGPIWAPTPTAAHPVLYFALHDLQTRSGKADVFLRADPFAGSLSVLGSVPDGTGSTAGLVAVPGALAFTFGCCEDLSVEVLPFLGATARQLSPTGSGFWESLGGATGSQVAVIHQTGQNQSYLWLDTSDGATSPLTVPPSLPSSASIGSVATDSAGHLEALTVGSGLPGGPALQGSVDVIDLHTGALSVSHPASALGYGLAFSPDGSALVYSSGGTLQVIATGAGAGAPPYRLPAASADDGAPTWSAPVPADGFGSLRTVSPAAADLVTQADAAAATSTTTSSSTTSTTTSTTTTSTSTTAAGPAPPVTTSPDLYVNTGADPGTLYAEPGFPAQIQVDNHDFLSALHWAGVGSPTSVADGTYNVDDCQPNCASGHYHQYPTQLTASQPRRCVVQVYDRASGNYRTEPAYAYNSLVARVSGAGQSATPAFGPACG